MGKELAKFGKKWSDEQTHIKAIMVGIEKGLIKKIKEEMEEMKVKRIYEGERIKIIEGKKKEMERLEKNAMKVLTTKKKVAMRCETCGSINCDGTKVTWRKWAISQRWSKNVLKKKTQAWGKQHA